jgi:adenosylmethionine-8-amino-7-oxononanoate aminotransferase
MVPGIRSDSRTNFQQMALSPVRSKAVTVIKNCLLNRSINITPLRVKGGVGNSYILEDGTEIYDASGGAAVSNIGRRSKRVETAMHKISKQGLSYIPSLGFDTNVTADLAYFMISSTNGRMRKAVFYSSGTNPRFFWFSIANHI